MATALVARAQTLVVETLNVRGMLKNRSPGRSVHDGAMSGFVRMLHYKANWRRCTLVMADPWFASSKICSNCGQLHQMPLSVGALVFL